MIQRWGIRRLSAAGPAASPRGWRERGQASAWRGVLKRPEAAQEAALGAARAAHRKQAPGATAAFERVP